MDIQKQDSALLPDDVKFKIEENGNVILPETKSSCAKSEMELCLTKNDSNDNEDTGDEGFSTPFEILAEFLSALMSKDYKNAFHYCKLILHYEPENETVQEFYPLIEEKIKLEAEVSSSDENSEEDDDDSENSENEELNDSAEVNGSTEYFSSSSTNDDAESEATSCSSASDDDSEDKE